MISAVLKRIIADDNKHKTNLQRLHDGEILGCKRGRLQVVIVYSFCTPCLAT